MTESMEQPQPTKEDVVELKNEDDSDSDDDVPDLEDDIDAQTAREQSQVFYKGAVSFKESWHFVMRLCMDSPSNYQ